MSRDWRQSSLRVCDLYGAASVGWFAMSLGVCAGARIPEEVACVSYQKIIELVSKRVAWCVVSVILHTFDLNTVVWVVLIPLGLSFSFAHVFILAIGSLPLSVQNLPLPRSVFDFLQKNGGFQQITSPDLSPFNF